MPHRTTRNISLTPELEAFVASSSGRYQSASEVVRAGLRLLQQDEQERETARREIQQKIAVGLEHARRGELLDGEAVFDELDRQHGG
jgi:antitoxin ParD1/3/4